MSVSDRTYTMQTLWGEVFSVYPRDYTADRAVAIFELAAELPEKLAFKAYAKAAFIRAELVLLNAH